MNLSLHTARSPVRPALSLCCLVLGAVLLSAGGLWAVSATALRIDFGLMGSQAAQRFGPQAVARVGAWQQLLEQLPAQDEAEQVRQVNAFFHDNLQYRLDSELYGREDYWATPLEALGHGAGDCEDFAIAKYLSLRHAGIDDERLKLVYVRARIGGSRSQITQAHMVLSYQASADQPPLILDSLISEVMPASLRTDLLPVFSFNHGGMWAQGASGSLGSATARLSHWRNVLERMAQQGVQW